MNEVTACWTQKTPMGDLYFECTDVGVSKLEYTVPKNAHETPPDPLVSNAIDDYFAGNFSALDAVPIDLTGLSQFRRDVIQSLRLIPPGEVMTYGELATKLGVNSARAVGQAVGSNPIPIISPCHRVVAADGTLGGYSGGIDNKRWLLSHEGIAPRGGGWVTRAEKRAAQSA
jgi:O-6-methylguanine DNA methyltransferase